MLRGGIVLAGLGALIGAAGAVALSHFLASMLFAVQPTDGATLALAGAVLGLVAAAATLVPAVRAGRIDPQQAFRVD